MPLIGEWLALPLAREAGSIEPGDEISEAFLYPAAERLLSRCDALWRINGASRGADEDVRRAMKMGLPVYCSLNEIPMIVRSPEVY